MANPLNVLLATLGDPGQLPGAISTTQRLADLAPAHGARIGFVRARGPFRCRPSAARRLVHAILDEDPDALVVDSIVAAYLRRRCAGSPVCRCWRASTAARGHGSRTAAGARPGALRPVRLPPRPGSCWRASIWPINLCSTASPGAACTSCRPAATSWWRRCIRHARRSAGRHDRPASGSRGGVPLRGELDPAQGHPGIARRLRRPTHDAAHCTSRSDRRRTVVRGPHPRAARRARPARAGLVHGR